MSTTEESTDVEWDGYTDYQQVAGRYASEIHDATAAAAMLQRVDQEGGDFRLREISEAASRITSAALLLEEQLEMWSNGSDEFEEILDDWQGDDGYIQRFKRTDFFNGAPDWLFDFVSQINRAGLLLGYLKAGREQEPENDGDPLDSEVQDVIEEMTL